MKLNSLSPAEAQALIAKGAQLIDIRGPDEHARERIPGAQSVPLDRLSSGSLGDHPADTLIFHCKSGSRTKMNAATLRASSACEAFILEGGIEAWKAAGNPVAKDAKQPLELNRQVQIAAGGLAFAGFVLGMAVHPAFYALSGAVGAGLVFAGITGTCAMARLLKFMPWNRAAFA
jgi:rhodanese-related sulfurtransferase